MYIYYSGLISLFNKANVRLTGRHFTHVCYCQFDRWERHIKIKPIFTPENDFENVVCILAPILSRPPSFNCNLCRGDRYGSDSLYHRNLTMGIIDFRRVNFQLAKLADANYQSAATSRRPYQGQHITCILLSWNSWKDGTSPISSVVRLRFLTHGHFQLFVWVKRCKSTRVTLLTLHCDVTVATQIMYRKVT